MRKIYTAWLNGFRNNSVSGRRSLNNSGNLENEKVVTVTLPDNQVRFQVVEVELVRVEIFPSVDFATSVYLYPTLARSLLFYRSANPSQRLWRRLNTRDRDGQPSLPPHQGWQGHHGHDRKEQAKTDQCSQCSAVVRILEQRMSYFFFKFSRQNWNAFPWIFNTSR